MQDDNAQTRKKNPSDNELGHINFIHVNNLNSCSFFFVSLLDSITKTLLKRRQVVAYFPHIPNRQVHMVECYSDGGFLTATRSRFQARRRHFGVTSGKVGEEDVGGFHPTKGLGVNFRDRSILRKTYLFPMVMA
jgi:hypothetical protein